MRKFDILDFMLLLAVVRGIGEEGCVKCRVVVMEERQLPFHAIHPIANVYTDP